MHAADADIKDCALPLIPESMDQDISSCFIAWGVGCGSSGWGRVLGVGIVCTGLQSIPIDDGRFDHNS